MPAVFGVFVLGFFLNASQPLPKSFDQFNAQFVKQFEHPVVTKSDYKSFNQ